MLLQPSNTERGRTLGAGSRHYDWLLIRGDVPRAPVDRVRAGKHTCRIRVLPPEARPEVPQYLDDLIRCNRHSPARSGAHRESRVVESGECA